MIWSDESSSCRDLAVELSSSLTTSLNLVGCKREGVDQIGSATVRFNKA